MFRNLRQKLTGKDEPADAQVQAEQGLDEPNQAEQVQEERVADIVNGAGVLPAGEPADFEADQDGPVTPGAAR